MKTRVTIELNNEEDSTEKSIVVAWCEEQDQGGKPIEWYYECKGWEGTALEFARGGFAPIEDDIKTILKQVLCEAVDRMEEENGVAKGKHRIE